MARVAAILLLALAPAAAAERRGLKEEATQALKKAVTFYRTHVARNGGYVYYTGADLKERWGEGKATPDQIWVQPPGTPTVGMAYLEAYAATKDKFYLDAARETADALVYGQLQSGGWTNHIDFNPRGARAGKYRNGKGGSWDASSLDDGQTPSALRMLIRADQALGFQHAPVHDAALYGLEALLKAQFPNGAFPQVWRGPVEAKPVKKASYPEYDWKTEGRVKNYWDLYTLNDYVAGYVFETMADAHRVYKDEKYKAAIEKLGDFLLLAQMPDPQPAWAQQYTYDMHPSWARKFEPPAVTSWESQDVMETLVRISLYTGKKKYLEAIPRALEYLRKSVLPDGMLARYYELRSNKPLYMDGKYQLTYDDSSAPSHYGWKQPSRLAEIEKFYRAAQGGSPNVAELDRGLRAKEGVGAVGGSLEDEVRKAIAALDDQGRWVSTFNGERLVGQPKFPKSFAYLNSAVFARNVETLSEYLAGK